MRVFLDANVLVSVLNKEYPLFSVSARVMSLSDREGVEVFTSPICLAIAFYFSEKKSGTELARTKIEILSKKLSMTSVDQQVLDQALENKQVRDLEDGLEYYSAIGNGCDVIVTEDVTDFYYSTIPVLNCGDFLKRYFY